MTHRLSSKPLIVSAGMPRSGSTFLFNLIREILLVKWPEGLVSAWVGKFDSLPKGEAYLLKTHHLGRYLRFRSRHSFYTYRDVRVAAISNMRKFEIPISMDFFHSAIGQYEIAKNSSELMVKYEELIKTPEHFANQIADVLGIGESVDASAIVRKVQDLSAPTGTHDTYPEETLFHKGHITGTTEDEWRQLLPKDLQKEVNDTYSWWFRQCGYPTS